MISPKRKKLENADRLSDLPDDVLLHILSFLKAKHAIQTCILSTRWKHLWKHLPSLNLTSSDFLTLKSFRKFVSQILTLRDSSATLLALDFYRRSKVERQILERIVKYAVKHRIQRLKLSVVSNFDWISSHILSCQNLTSLSLSIKPRVYQEASYFLHSLNLPALTSLYLEHFTFRGDDNRGNGRVMPFSRLKKLKSLVISQCRIVCATSLYISSNTLVKLTIHKGGSRRGDTDKIELSAPNICSIAFTGSTPSKNLCGRFSISNR